MNREDLWNLFKMTGKIEYYLKSLSQWEIYLNIDRGFLVKYRRNHDKENNRNCR